MTVTKEIIANALLECLIVSLDTESGSINLKDYGLSQKGAILRVFTRFENASTGQDLDITQDGDSVLALDAAAGTFVTKNDMFNRPGFVFTTSDTLLLAYNVTEEATVKIYFATNPHL